jgi:hypothetical protein
MGKPSGIAGVAEHVHVGDGQDGIVGKDCFGLGMVLLADSSEAALLWSKDV